MPDTSSRLYQVRAPLFFFILVRQFGGISGGTAYMTYVEDLGEYPHGSHGPKSHPWEDSEEPQVTLPLSGCVNYFPQF